ncbi:hypothetical protein BTVI_20816 [Pitangus sulphuratus]|nr:hypothetical protein BTVI_20816 [Pitangus sulphuratus]
MKSRTGTGNIQRQPWKATSNLGCSKGSVTRRLRVKILSLYSALQRPHLVCCIQLWGPQYKKGLDLLKAVQRRVTKLTTELRDLFMKTAKVVQPGEKALERH